MRRAKTIYRCNFGIAVAGIALLSVGAVSRAALVNFNTGPSDVTNNFNVNFDGAPVPTAPGAGSNFNWSATAGVSDNGGNPGGGELRIDAVGQRGDCPGILHPIGEPRAESRQARLRQHQFQTLGAKPGDQARIGEGTQQQIVRRH